MKFTMGLMGLLYVLARARAMPEACTPMRWLGGRVALVAGVAVALGWPRVRLPDALAAFLHAAGGRLYTKSVPDLLALTVAARLLVPAGLDCAAACRRRGRG